jgi:hypothetical protein
MLNKNSIKFQYHINRVHALIILEKSHLSYMVSDSFYVKVIALGEIYKFISLDFFI